MEAPRGPRWADGASGGQADGKILLIATLHFETEAHQHAWLLSADRTAVVEAAL